MNKHDSTTSLPSLPSARDLAKILGVTISTIRRFDSNCIIPAPVRFGGSTRWRPEDIQKWIDDGCPGLKDRYRGHVTENKTESP